MVQGVFYSLFVFSGIAMEFLYFVLFNTVYISVSVYIGL